MEACKVCDNNCGYCKFDCNCATEVQDKKVAQAEFYRDAQKEERLLASSGNLTIEQKAEEYVKKDGTETEKLLNSVKLSLTKESIVSDRVIKKVRELIGQEKWQELHDEESDIITTTGELLITLKLTKELEKELTEKDKQIKNLEIMLQAEREVRVNEDYLKKVTELEAQIEKMKKYGKLLQDICVVLGNDNFMVSVQLDAVVEKLWDKSEEQEGHKMVEDILNRLLEIKPQDWAEFGN